jgi:hypothetical protein
MMMSDAIEMRVSSWFNVLVDARVGPDYMVVECNNLRWHLYTDGTMARVDGGDPGDEND